MRNMLYENKSQEKRVAYMIIQCVRVRDQVNAWVLTGDKVFFSKNKKIIFHHTKTR